MTFRQWLKQFKEDDTPLGDLARDMDMEMRDYRWAKKRGETFHPPGIHETYKPWRNSYRWIKRHLEALHACAGAMETFELAWREYQRNHVGD